MHQSVRQCAITDEQQQTRRVDVEPAHADPASPGKLRQPVETGRPPFRVRSSADHPFGLVHQQDSRIRRPTTQHFSVHPNPVILRDATAQGCWLSVDFDSTRFDPAFHFASRTGAQIGEHFLQLLGNHRLIHRLPLLALAPRVAAP